eukprot:CAMPEP_0113330704 /NCGR_PEP_ID=MMETSP0010_2-20120614/21877_1 /TAXON_ID=216773 ORGANISM="Corethron hystrix, Strain 308" /NCGR_SAMPLE_ID=MMETSP0010_2 /ASSEMBLY_ACC=CAM_ASM_000155 /LENGTH=560 /DNA_ID=CAMNT_0000193481 /DNA_START=297 /DNA_END=1980 /DNA_ORIENTATION=+ /assembly_acc=CAM_ASM_000155
MDPPARFLEKNQTTGLYDDIGEDKAISKVGQALRENAKETREKIEADRKKAREIVESSPTGGGGSGGLALSPSNDSVDSREANRRVSDYSTRNYNMLGDTRRMSQYSNMSTRNHSGISAQYPHPHPRTYSASRPLVHSASPPSVQQAQRQRPPYDSYYNSPHAANAYHTQLPDAQYVFYHPEPGAHRAHRRSLSNNVILSDDIDSLMSRRSRAGTADEFSSLGYTAPNFNDTSPLGLGSRAGGSDDLSSHAYFYPPQDQINISSGPVARSPRHVRTHSLPFVLDDPLVAQPSHDQSIDQQYHPHDPNVSLRTHPGRSYNSPLPSEMGIVSKRAPPKELYGLSGTVKSYDESESALDQALESLKDDSVNENSNNADNNKLQLLPPARGFSKNHSLEMPPTDKNGNDYGVALSDILSKRSQSPSAPNFNPRFDDVVTNDLSLLRRFHGGRPTLGGTTSIMSIDSICLDDDKKEENNDTRQAEVASANRRFQGGRPNIVSRVSEMSIGTFAIDDIGNVLDLADFPGAEESLCDHPSQPSQESPSGRSAPEKRGVQPTSSVMSL